MRDYPLPVYVPPRRMLPVIIWEKRGRECMPAVYGWLVNFN